MKLYKQYQDMEASSENRSKCICLWSAEDAEKWSLTNQG